MITLEGPLLPWRSPPPAMKTERTWSEADLISGCRAGRRDAFEALVGSYHDRLHRIAAAMAGTEAAGDLVQETFLAAVEGFHRFRGEAQLSTWLISILRNRFSLYLRVQKKWKLAPLPGDGGPLPAPEPPAVERELRRILTRVQELPEDLRTALVLFHIDEMSYADIAKAMECPVGTVRSRLFEARERLRKLVLEAENR